MQSVHDINKLARALGGVPVLGCIPGSPSHRAGVRFGDILLYANGQRVEDLDGYIAARQCDPLAMSLVVFRDGREQTLSFGLGEYQASEAELRTFFDEHESLVRFAIESGSTQTGSDTI